LCEVVIIQLEKHQQAMRRYHARNISSRGFKFGDFILQKIETTKDRHKLSPVWVGSFEVVEVTQPNLYKLQWEDSSEVPNSWNIDLLRLFYI
jgi:hypothetical protein